MLDNTPWLVSQTALFFSRRIQQNNANSINSHQSDVSAERKMFTKSTVRRTDEQGKLRRETFMLTGIGNPFRDVEASERCSSSLISSPALISSLGSAPGKMHHVHCYQDESTKNYARALDEASREAPTRSKESGKNFAELLAIEMSIVSIRCLPNDSPALTEGTFFKGKTTKW